MSGIRLLTIVLIYCTLLLRTLDIHCLLDSSPVKFINLLILLNIIFNYTNDTCRVGRVSKSFEFSMKTIPAYIRKQFLVNNL